ncbi:hypothetical protein BGC_32530 [Burkholderia sp. 3C]
MEFVRNAKRIAEQQAVEAAAQAADSEGRRRGHAGKSRVPMAHIIAEVARFDQRTEPVCGRIESRAVTLIESASPLRAIRAACSRARSA